MKEKIRNVSWRLIIVSILMFSKIVKSAFCSSEKRALLTSRRAFVSFEKEKMWCTERNGTEDLRLLGICGGIGSGKSAACSILSSNPQLFPNVVRCIDSDKVAHDIYSSNKEVINEIQEAFGNDVISCENGELDRGELGKIVFHDIHSMNTLEGIVWPHMKNKILNLCCKTERSTSFDSNVHAPVVVIEAAVMIDAGWHDILDGLWVIESSESTQQQRLNEHRGLVIQDAIQRITSQRMRRGIGNPDEELQNGVVTAIIENNGSIELFKQFLAKTWEDPSSWKQSKHPKLQ